MLFCSVLDLNAFERQNKAEGLGMVSEEGTSKSNFSLYYSFIKLQSQIERKLTPTHTHTNTHCGQKYVHTPPNERAWVNDAHKVRSVTGEICVGQTKAHREELQSSSQELCDGV